jgi:hypothetical protein
MNRSYRDALFKCDRTRQVIWGGLFLQDDIASVSDRPIADTGTGFDFHNFPIANEELYALQLELEGNIKFQLGQGHLVNYRLDGR